MIDFGTFFALMTDENYYRVSFVPANQNLDRCGPVAEARVNESASRVLLIHRELSCDWLTDFDDQFCGVRPSMSTYAAACINYRLYS